MKLPRRIHLKTVVMIVLMILFGSSGDVLLSKGMKRIGSLPLSSVWTATAAFLGTFRSGFVWMGVTSLLLFFVCYLLVLSWADYSYVSPASATSYAVVALMGAMLLGEAVTSVRWAGVIFICLGVALVGHTPPRTTERS